MDLFVCLPTRDRIILTQKTIDSLLSFSSVFKNIHIYVFDNLSCTNKERILYFYQLLEEGKIKYYSHDTSVSLTNCFGKSVIFERWLNMMMNDYNIKQSKMLDNKNYYLLIDNDVIVGPNWDKYFLSASEFIETSGKEKLLYFFIQYPGGVPKIHRDKIFTKYIVQNKYLNNKNYELTSYGSGGGSGFWFMNTKQLMMMNSLWNYRMISDTHNQFKKHDTSTWFAIKKKHGAIKYTAAIKAEQPLVLHLGGVIGSICNVLTSKQNYDEKRVVMNLKEETLKNLSILEIFEKYKNNENAYNW